MELAPGHDDGTPCHGGSGTVSILVFVELAPGPYTGSGNRYLSLFQSLFLWNSRPDLVIPHHVIEGIFVSILVFVELAPGRALDGELVIGDYVSILVFVELAPGQDETGG